MNSISQTPRTFPPELLTIVVNYAEHDLESPYKVKTLKALAICSRHLTSITTPLLFQSAKWGNVGEYRAQARFYSMKPTRESQVESVDNKKGKGKGEGKGKGVDLASFIKKLDVLIDLPVGMTWIREKRLSDLKELLDINRFPNFKKVNDLKLISEGEHHQPEMRETLAEIIRILTPRLTILKLNLNSFITLFDVATEKFERELKDEEWPEEIEELTIHIDSKRSLPDGDILSSESIYRGINTALRILNKSGTSKPFLRFDFGSTFHQSTRIILEMFLVALGYSAEKGKKFTEKKKFNLHLRGGLKISRHLNRNPLDKRAGFLERDFFVLEGDLAKRTLAEFKNPELCSIDLVA